jgi:hypothetical protein
MDEIKWEKCKVIWCFAKRPKHNFVLKSTEGICLEEVGVPGKGTALINRTITPKIGDLVWCNNYMCTINGFIKQVKSIDGDEMIVTTRYKDHSKNFQFYCCECYGVVEMVFNSTGDLCYRRTDND